MRIILNGKTVEFTDDVAKKLLGSLVKISFEEERDMYVGVVVAVTRSERCLWSVWFSVPDKVKTLKEAIKKALVSFIKEGIVPRVFDSNDSAVRYFHRMYKTDNPLEYPQSYLPLHNKAGICDVLGKVRK